MEKLIKLVNEFRNAIDDAKEAGEFVNDIVFYQFPRACCGDASDLLAEYLLNNGIKTYYVCGTYRNGTPENFQSHAWLITEDNVVIDITGDQFKFEDEFLNYNYPVYVGQADDFHNLFMVEDIDVHENNGLVALGNICFPRLMDLYYKIEKYI